jgi:hypothetical protein
VTTPVTAASICLLGESDDRDRRPPHGGAPATPDLQAAGGRRAFLDAIAAGGNGPTTMTGDGGGGGTGDERCACVAFREETA